MASILSRPSVREQRRATQRLAKAFNQHDAAEGLLTDSASELDEAFRMWSVGKSINRHEARAMLENMGMVKRKTK